MDDPIIDAAAAAAAAAEEQVPQDEEDHLEEAQQDENHHDDEQVMLDDNNNEEDDDDDDDAVWNIRAEFNAQWRKINENDDDFQVFDARLCLDDVAAMRVAQALIGNVSVTAMAIHLSPELTTFGARALAGSIVGSNVQLVALHAHGALPLQVSYLYTLTLHTVRNILLSFPLEDHHATTLGAGLEGNKCVEFLAIHVDHLTPRGAKALSRGMAQSKIAILELAGPTADEAAASSSSKDIATVMNTMYLDGVQKCPSLHELTLTRAIGDASALAMILPNITTLILEDTTTLHLSEMEILSRGFAQAPKLEYLSLLRCELGDEHMRILSSSLGNHPCISKLELQGNVFGDAGIVAFAEHWNGRNSHLCQLDVHQNPNIGPHGAQQLMRALSGHGQLRRLNFESNKSIGYDGLHLIGKELPGKKLVSLDVSRVAQWKEYENGKSDEAMEQEAKRALASQSLLEGVRGNVYLTTLCTQGLNLTTTVEEELQLYLRANQQGRCHLLEQDTLPPTIWCHFLARQCLTSSLRFVFLRDLPVLMNCHTFNGVATDNKRGLMSGHVVEQKRRRLDNST